MTRAEIFIKRGRYGLAKVRAPFTPTRFIYPWRTQGQAKMPRDLFSQSRKR